jgi:hypothetical protein
MAELLARLHEGPLPALARALVAVFACWDSRVRRWKRSRSSCREGDAAARVGGRYAVSEFRE